MNKYISIFLIILLISCQTNNDGNSRSLNSKNSEMVVNININNIAKPLKFSKIFDSLYYVPIEIPKNIPEIAEIYKIKVFDKKIGILDDFNAALHIVDYSGNLINAFYADGSEGKGTFQDLEDFEILGDTLFLYQRSTQVIHKYNIYSKIYYGNLPVNLLLIELNFFQDKFFVYADDDRFGLSDQRSNKLQIFNKSFDHLIYSSIPYVPGRDEFDTPQRFYKYADRIYFSDIFNDTIYSFKGDDILAEYAINWGPYHIPKQLLFTNDQETIAGKFFEQKYRGFKHFLMATEDWLSFWYRQGLDQNFFFYDKNSEKEFNISSFVDDKNGGTLPFPMTFDFKNDLFISVIPKEYIEYEQKEFDVKSNLGDVFSEENLNYLLFYQIKN